MFKTNKLDKLMVTLALAVVMLVGLVGCSSVNGTPTPEKKVENQQEIKDVLDSVASEDIVVEDDGTVVVVKDGEKIVIDSNDIENSDDEVKGKVESVKNKDIKTSDSEKGNAVSKPAPTKPTETKPVETKPAETKPVETKPAETKPVVTYKEVYEDISIPFGEIVKEDSSLEAGKTRVEAEGSNGNKRITYKVTYTDGKETNRTKVSETVTSNPKDKVIVKGTYTTPNNGVSDAAAAQEMFRLLNEHRSANGLPALAWNSSLVYAAEIRAHEIVQSFSHTRPNGQPWYTIDSYDMNGENLAKGGSTTQKAMDGLKASSGHNKNMLGNYRSVAIVKLTGHNGGHYWVQIFTE